MCPPPDTSVKPKVGPDSSELLSGPISYVEVEGLVELGFVGSGTCGEDS